MKKWLVIGFVILGLFLCWFLYRIIYDRNSNLSDMKDSSRDYLVLIDTLQLSKSEIICWYKKQDLLNSSSVSYLSIVNNVCELPKSPVLIEGDNILAINEFRSDTIFLKTLSGFKILNTNYRYIFKDIGFERGEEFKRWNLELEVPFKNICK